MPELLEPVLIFLIFFMRIFFELLYYSIFAWVILSWIMLFGAIKPNNRMFIFFTRLVEPILKPFRWARLGALDLSPIVAIVVLGLILSYFEQITLSLI